MFGISGEHLLILGIVLLIFGPKRLPELGNTLGKAMRNFKDALSGVEDAKFRRLDETPPSGKPFPGDGHIETVHAEAAAVKPADPAATGTPGTGTEGSGTGGGGSTPPASGSIT